MNKFETLEDLYTYKARVSQMTGECTVHNVIEAVRYSRVSKPSSVDHVKQLSRKPTAAEAFEYAKALDKFEIEFDEYNKLLRVYLDDETRVNRLLTEFIKQESGLNDIPLEYQSKLYNYAYNHAHSEGMYGIYNALLDLVEIFD